MQPNYRQRLIDYIRENARPVDKFSHQARLYKLAQRLGEGEVYDDDVVFGACWIHDLGVFIGHRPEDPSALAQWDHLAYVLQKGPEVLAKTGFPPEKIPAVLAAVRTHMPSAEPATVEAILVRDADILEQLGAVGILRTVSKVGRDTRFRTFADALGVLRKSATELPPKLRLKSARIEAEQRIHLMESFLASAEKESAEVTW
jgi:uncharacterized protein